MLYETRFLLALITTWTIEIPVLIIFVRCLFHRINLSLAGIAGAGLLCTALTLPYLWFVLPPFVDAAYYPVIGETLVVIVEAVIINRVLGLDAARAFVCSLMMNMVSFLIGLFLL